VLAVLTDVSARKQAEEKLALLSRKILIAQEEERARLSRDLHDELGQLLTAQRLELDWLQKRMKPVELEDPLGFENAVKLVEDATGELRRICRGLRPPLLDDLGIEPAVGLLVQEFEERTGIVTDLDVRLEDDLEGLTRELALCIYRILQESLTNVSRHSGARNVSITLAYSARSLLLSVYDDGSGFETEQASVARGSGITGMQERARLVGGSVEVRSAPDKGTRVVFRVPGEEQGP
jgi:signal transduction histidine kinase